MGFLKTLRLCMADFTACVIWVFSTAFLGEVRAMLPKTRPSLADTSRKHTCCRIIGKSAQLG